MFRARPWIAAFNNTSISGNVTLYDLTHTPNSTYDKIAGSTLLLMSASLELEPSGLDPIYKR
ncbi:MAG: hypothetical protein QXS42_02005 [Zestosphaera sp.]